MTGFVFIVIRAVYVLIFRDMTVLLRVLIDSIVKHVVIRIISPVIILTLDPHHRVMISPPNIGIVFL